MQAKKTPRLRPSTREEILAFQRFCSSIGLDLAQCARSLYTLEVPGGDYVELFDPPPSAVEFARSRLGMVIYSIGGYLGIYDPRKGRFRPGLPLAHKLAPLCRSGARCCVLTSHGEKRFLYGRPVQEPHILKALGEGPCLVINTSGEALGWGILSARKSKNGARETSLEPVIDMGWYLRRGG